jgi:hypothetical protein
VVAPQDAHRRLQRILRQSTPPRWVVDHGEGADLSTVADQQVDRSQLPDREILGRTSLVALVDEEQVEGGQRAAGESVTQFVERTHDETISSRIRR